MLGPNVSKWQYPIGSLLQSGAKVAFGSDWFVSSLNPLDGIETAVTHKILGDEEGDIFLPEQRISLSDAIRAYTLHAAYINHVDDITGSLEVGKQPNFIIVSENPFKVKPTEIHCIRVLESCFNGHCVYAAKTFNPIYTIQNVSNHKKHKNK